MRALYYNVILLSLVCVFNMYSFRRCRSTTISSRLCVFVSRVQRPVESGHVKFRFVVVWLSCNTVTTMIDGASHPYFPCSRLSVILGGMTWKIIDLNWVHFSERLVCYGSFRTPDKVVVSASISFLIPVAWCSCAAGCTLDAASQSATVKSLPIGMWRVWAHANYHSML